MKWIKITTDIFDDEKILLIESLPDAYSIIVVWFKLLCLAGKQNNSGVFMMGRIAYTDKMLATIIPALRWVYEYKLDVDYCVECCNVADAKIEHHRRKLRNRIQSIENILGDLEYRDYDEEEIRYEKKKVADLIDYNVPFCSGKKNKAFYSVIESTLYINKR